MRPGMGPPGPYRPPPPPGQYHPGGGYAPPMYTMPPPPNPSLHGSPVPNGYPQPQQRSQEGEQPEGPSSGGTYGPSPGPLGPIPAHMQQQQQTAYQDSDNQSFRSTTSVNTNVTLQSAMGASGESLEVYRQNAKRSNDPAVQLEFAKMLIASGEAIPLEAGGDAKKNKRHQEALFQEALKLIKKLVTNGGMGGKSSHAESQFFLAECYGNGSLHLPVDHDRAFSLYVQASKQAHPAATYRTAVCYEVGAGTKRDSARSMQFYRKAAALGDTAAMYKVGMIMMNGLLGQGKNPREGVTWLKRAAAQADENTPHALHELGVLYEGGASETGVVIPVSCSACRCFYQCRSFTRVPFHSNVPVALPFCLHQDPQHAHELFLRAAQLGYAASQFKLGFCYEYGLLALPVDPRRSIAWYTRAAEQTDPDAELALSGWYLTGAEGVLRQSDTEAYLWARKAADKGLAKAEYAVGWYSENAVGVKADLEEARRWYLRAAAQGNKRAVARVKELKSVMYATQRAPAGHHAPPPPTAQVGGSVRVAGQHGSGGRPAAAGTVEGQERDGNWRKQGTGAKDSECIVM
ncbi:hypothetical protein HKX48_003838 [Thoreauomyces humboldtii]|nr:hypothetical protein HKX48_003838 [Thoreauomyces humboldtii]